MTLVISKYANAMNSMNSNDGGIEFDDEDLVDLDFLCEEEDDMDGVSILKTQRWQHKRINWELHVQKLLHEKHFVTEYRMSFNAFTHLCFLLSPLLE